MGSMVLDTNNADSAQV